MRISKRQINTSGQLTGCGFHDSVLVQLSVDFGTRLSARFRRADNSMVGLTLEGLGPVGAIGLRNNAIASDVFIWTPQDVPAASLAMPDGVWSVLFGGDLPPIDVGRAAQSLVAAAEFAWVVLIECSYGGSLAALCKQIEVTEG